jgi:hypothetical protein
MKISNRDWGQLSAFLDGELSRRDKIQLEKRMKVNPDLQAALEELKITKQILSKTPLIPIPRNFTLSSAQIGIKTRQPVYRRYRLAAALMSFVFIGVLILDFGGIFLGGTFAPAMAPKSQEVFFDTAGESAVDEMEEPALMAADAEAESDRAFAEEVSVPSETADAVVEVMEEAAVSTTEMEEGLAEEVSSEAETDTIEEAAPAVGAESPGESKTTSDEETGDGDSVAEESADQAQENLAVPTAAAEDVSQPNQPFTYAEEAPVWEEPTRQPLSLLRILEIILALGVIGLGAAAWAHRRRDSKQI